MTKFRQQILAIIKALDEKRINPAALSARERELVVLTLISEDSTISNVRMAELLQITDVQVGRIRHRILERTDFDFDGEVRQLLRSMTTKKQDFQRRAAAAKDFATAWRIEKEYIEILQSLGVVWRAPQKYAVAHLDGEQTFKDELKRFFNEYGVPTAEAFARLIRDAANGNGDGQGRTIPGTGDGAHRPPLILPLPDPGQEGSGHGDPQSP